jgi:hypothetical protein
MSYNVTIVSQAVWPKEEVKLYNQLNESRDTHGSVTAAEAVCQMLRDRGFGGDGKIFPLSTRVLCLVNGHDLGGTATISRWMDEEEVNDRRRQLENHDVKYEQIVLEKRWGPPGADNKVIQKRLLVFRPDQLGKHDT